MAFRCVCFRLITIVGERSMASWRTTSPCRRLFEIDRDLPFPETAAFGARHFFTVGGVGLVAGSAGATFTLVHHMEIMQISISIAEPRVDGCLVEPQHIVVVALQAKAVHAILVRCVERIRVVAAENASVFGAVGVVTDAAGAFYRTMEEFFAFQLLGHVPQRRIAKVANIVAAEADTSFLFRQQPRCLREMA